MRPNDDLWGSGESWAVVQLAGPMEHAKPALPRHFRKWSEKAMTVREKRLFILRIACIATMLTCTVISRSSADQEWQKFWLYLSGLCGGILIGVSNWEELIEKWKEFTGQKSQ